MNLSDNHHLMTSEAKYKSVYGEGFKILTPKKMLQK